MDIRPVSVFAISGRHCLRSPRVGQDQTKSPAGQPIFADRYRPRLPREGFYFIEKEDPADVLKLILEMVKERIPKRFGFDPIDDIQVLTPMHKGVVGAGKDGIRHARRRRVSNRINRRGKVLG